MPAIPFSATQDNLAATSSPDDPATPCAPGSGFTVWFVYTPTAATAVSVATSGGDLFPPTVTVFAGHPGALTNPQCASQLSLTAGTTYYFMLSSFTPRPTWTFTIRATTPPPNDLIVDATRVTALPFSATQDNLTATSSPDDPATPCAPGSSFTVWFVYTPTAATAVSVATSGGDLFPPTVTVFAGRPGALTNPQCASQLSLTAGTTYYFMLSSFTPRPTWTFTIQVTALAVTTTSLPNATLGSAYHSTLTASGGVGPNRWSVLSGSLPSGLTLTQTGRLSGKALVPGTTTFTVSVMDSETPVMVSTATLSITVGGCVTTVTGTHTGPVGIGQGVTCINGATLSGPVFVSHGAVVAVTGSQIDGPLVVFGATQLSVCGSKITHSVFVIGSSGYVLVGDAGGDSPPGCEPNAIRGAVYLSHNSGGVGLGGNTITGLVLVMGNSASGAEIEGNHINGPLVCLTNAPPPTDDNLPNVVAGSVIGQCRTLVR